MLRKNFPQRKAQRRADAATRQAAFDALTDDEKATRKVRPRKVAP